MNWDNFIFFGGISVLLWTVGAFFAYKRTRFIWSAVFQLAGIAVFALFTAGLWVTLQRPPMRTMGETRLLYSLFVSITGLLIYLRWKYVWIPIFTTILATVFVVVNIVKPQIHDQTLIPVLQSGWFVPHVIVYMFSYALTGCAAVLLVYGWCAKEYKQFSRRKILLGQADNLVYTGISLLTIGMLFGAIWAKQAWGHYWDWDPKETWAAVTWFSYLIYIHFRIRYPNKYKLATAILVIAFVFLQICWYGIRYLPSAGESIHVY